LVFQRADALTIPNEQVKRAKIVHSFKKDLKGYLHGIFLVNLATTRTVDGGAYFDNNDPQSPIISDKLYINAEDGENLKTKDDVEEFVNGRHDGRFLSEVYHTDEVTDRTVVVGELKISICQALKVLVTLFMLRK
jgi:hypothetical protein